MMMTYIAMLRGINVGRGKAVKMERLRTSFTALGFGEVRTYVQSGNVVFQSERKSELIRTIEAKIQHDFGFTVPVLIKTSKELAQIVRDNPLLRVRGSTFPNYTSHSCPKFRRKQRPGCWKIWPRHGNDFEF
jgi:uncharacterized protein (DUF1697 family)